MKPNFFVELTLTNACNCNCTYCFEGLHTDSCRNEKEEDKQLTLLVDAILHFDNSKYDKFVISFWGGEPFMNTDFMYKIINATCKYDFVHYNYYSNGSLVEKYADFLKLNFISAIHDRIRILLSFDGIPIHYTKRGNNVLQILTVADMLRAANIDFSFKATLPFDMIDKMSVVWDSYYWLFLRYGNNVSYSPTLDTSCKDYNIIDENLEAFKKSILDICKKEYIFYNKYGRFLTSILNGNKNNCNINNSIFMHTDGNIYYCHGCPYKLDNENLKICKTDNVHSLYDVKERSVDLTKTNEVCKYCSATYCSVCHIMLLDKNDDPIEKWISCKSNNLLCKYYKAFGNLSRLLKYAIVYKELAYG